MKVQIPDAVFMVLTGLCSGEPLDVVDGELCLLSGGEPLPVEVEILDALEAFGWVVITRAGAVVTRLGRAGLNEWFRKRFPGRRMKVSKLRPARLTAVGRAR